MIIFIVDVIGLAIFESERHPPISRYPDGPPAFRRTFERMKPQSRQVDVLRTAASIQNRQYVAKLFNMSRRYAPDRPAIV
jgi:hypothetical protein